MAAVTLRETEHNKVIQLVSANLGGHTLSKPLLVAGHMTALGANLAGE